MEGCRTRNYLDDFCYIDFCELCLNLIKSYFSRWSPLLSVVNVVVVTSQLSSKLIRQSEVCFLTRCLVLSHRAWLGGLISLKIQDHLIFFLHKTLTNLSTTFEGKHILVGVTIMKTVHFPQIDYNYGKISNFYHSAAV